MAQLGGALEAAHIKDLVADLESWPTTAESFDQAHRKLCRKIREHLQVGTRQQAHYGRIAKLVAIYFKVTVVLAGFHDSQFAKLMHPPIDSILLGRIASDADLPVPVRDAVRHVCWTKLSENAYYELINHLRSVVVPGQPFWTLERYWKAALAL